MPRKASLKSADSTANLGFEAKLWLAADKLRNNMDAAEYKHVVLGLIFLKYIFDRFAEHWAMNFRSLAPVGSAPSGRTFNLAFEPKALWAIASRPVGASNQEERNA